MNDWYSKAKQKLLTAGIDILTDDIRGVFIDTSAYTVDLDTDEFLSDVAAPARVGTPQSLANKSVTLGVMDADNLLFTALTGPSAEAFILYKWTGVDATSPLLLYLDGRFTVEVAVNASLGATTVVSEDLPEAVNTGAVLTLVSGAGPATITLTAGAAAGARTLACSALSSGITAGALYEYPMANSGLPVTPNGGNAEFNWSDGPAKIARL